jgi:hypothetical protein
MFQAILDGARVKRFSQAVSKLARGEYFDYLSLAILACAILACAYYLLSWSRTWTHPEGYLSILHNGAAGGWPGVSGLTSFFL